MATLNRKITKAPVFTKEGAPAVNVPALLELRRAVLATMLWEDSFYESGVEIADRIGSLVPKVSGKAASALAIELRSKGKLRHVPLKVVREMARTEAQKPFVAETLAQVIQRPDELTEFLAIYWKDLRPDGSKQKLSAQVKKGLAKAFTKFDAFQLSKYNRDNAIKLRDVLFLCHAKPKDKEQEAVWKQLIDDKLATADTWESRLSATKGEKKDEAWEALLKEGKLGALALLRNLRNMKEAKVDESLIRQAILNVNVERVLPFRFITAARYAPNLEPELEVAMLKCLDTREKIKGKTVLLLDVSVSMDRKVSAKSEILRIDAASALAILAREVFEDVEVYTFSDSVKQVPTRRGFALRDAIVNSQVHSGTNMGLAISEINNRVKYDRLIAFTDEQSHDRVGNPRAGAKGYVVNVANERYGVGYGAWNHIDGFSESILDYIVEFEKIL
jgi:60 kDa SS-A/Ro ribonucleoprotein